MVRCSYTIGGAEFYCRVDVYGNCCLEKLSFFEPALYKYQASLASHSCTVEQYAARFQNINSSLRFYKHKQKSSELLNIFFNSIFFNFNSAKYNLTNELFWISSKH